MYICIYILFISNKLKTSKNYNHCLKLTLNINFNVVQRSRYIAHSEMRSSRDRSASQRRTAD